MSPDRSPNRPPQPLTRAARLALPWVVLAAAALAPLAGHAQVGVSASLLSEYSVRGVSLSRGHPSPQLRLDIDGSGGWYGGALLARVALADSPASLQLLAYGGYARTLAPGLSWDAGALAATFRHGAEYRYHEFYAGLARDRIAARVWFSPSYYGSGKTVYAELNASWPLGAGVTLSGHAGALRPLGSGDMATRLDLRAGLGVELGHCTVQLAVMASAPRRRQDAARALALSASYAF